MSLTLVTGAPGWIGTRLVRVLIEGAPDAVDLPSVGCDCSVRCLVLPGMDTSHLPSSSRLEILPGDLRNLEDMRAFCRGAEGATLYHCAGIVHPQRYVREFNEVNVQGTRNLLQAAEEARVGRVVVLSSNSPIGVNPYREHCFTEESPYHPYMGYGRSKMLMEQIVHEYQRRGILETVILRPTWFYGPDQPERQTTFFRMIKSGGAPIVGDGGNLRSMVYIDNLCQAMLLCELSPIANGKTYWVADAHPYPMNEIVDTIERLMETEFGIKVAHKRLRLPSVASEVAWLSDALIQKAGLYQQKIHVLSEMNKTIACSVDKARRELGYNPLITLEEGMRRSLAWCVENRITI